MFRLSKTLLNTFVPWNKQLIKQPVITNANGIFIFNNKQKIVDFTSGQMAVNLGHNNKYILEGFNNHINKGISYVSPTVFTTDEREILCKRLIDYTMKEGKVMLTNGGADSNEFSIFISRIYSQKIGENKTKILSFKTSYHGGSTIGSSLISGDSRLNAQRSYNKLSLEPIMDNPSLLDEGESSLQQVEDLFKKNNICAILIEGSSGSAGCHIYPDNYMNKLEKLCRKYNILIICDEVMSGWGRTCLLYTSPSPRDAHESRMPSSA